MICVRAQALQPARFGEQAYSSQHYTFELGEIITKQYFKPREVDNGLLMRQTRAELRRASRTFHANGNSD